MVLGKINAEWLEGARQNELDEGIEAWFGEALNQHVYIDFADGTLWLHGANCWASQEQIDQATKTIDGWAT